MSPVDSGALDTVVTLDVPDGTSGSYTPLDPPAGHYAIVSEGAGVVLLRGRYHAGVTTATRLHWDGRTFHVDLVVNKKREDEALLTCREVFE